MNSDVMKQCADMIITDAIQDFSAHLGLPSASIRNQFIESGAYEALYDHETGLWQEGPDYFIDFFKQTKQAS